MLVINNPNINLKKIFQTAGLCLLVVVASFFIEIKKQSPLVGQLAANIFAISSNSNAENLAVSYALEADGSQLQAYNNDHLAFPTFIEAEEDMTLQIYNHTYLTLSKGTQLRTLIFTKDKLHLHLISGDLVLDTRQSQKNILVQTDNILLKPFLHGVYVLGKTSDSTKLYAQQGQAILGVYSARGNIQEKILLFKKALLEFQGDLNIYKYDMVSNLEPPTFYKLAKEAGLLRDLEADILSEQALTLQYKGQIIDPESQENIFSGLVRSLTLNEKKRDYLNLYPFIKQLSLAQDHYLSNEESKGNIALKQAFQEFSFAQQDSVQSLGSFTRFIDTIYPIYINLSPQDKLEPLKTNLIDKYSLYLHENLKDSYQQKAVFSYLNDIYYYYQNDSIALAQDTVEKLNQLLQIWNPPEDETLIFISQIIDNILLSFPKSNNQSTHQLRQDFYNLISTAEYEKDFQKQNKNHLERLEEYFTEKTIPTSYLAESIQILQLNISDFTKRDFAEFFEAVEVKALQ